MNVTLFLTAQEINTDIWFNFGLTDIIDNWKKSNTKYKKYMGY